jgi:DNA polymerase (family 10)
MTIDNYHIADQFSLLAKLMEIHGDNAFKAKSYAVAAFNIEKLPVQLSEIEKSKIPGLKGIGDSLAKKVIEIIDNGHLQTLEEYVRKTPPGIMEMLAIKGLGPKKISVIWKEMEIETLGELLYACTENRLARYKGFGEKTQKTIEEAINFFMRSQGSYLFAQVEEYAHKLKKTLSSHFSKEQFAFTGSFARQCEVIEKIEWVSTAKVDALRQFFESNGFTVEEELANTISFRGAEKVLVEFHCYPAKLFYQELFNTSASPEFLEQWNKKYKSGEANSEEAIFKTAGLHFIPAFLRESPAIIERAAKDDFKNIIQPGDIRGIVHSHSDWSDGSNTLPQMAEACIKRGLEYLVISDHSKSAFYANGLSEERIREQHAFIDELNRKLKPFRIFKSIECDILGDGALDYSDNVLSTFDLVICSIHANIKMNEEKAMLRLLTAIQNPYCRILGHMTARLLLSRPGYPVNHLKVIEACAKNNVVIEINANPRRLDMDWRWIQPALESGVLLSVNPDAHDIDEFNNCRYGVLAAQKGALTKDRNLSSFSLKEFEQWLSKK